MLIKILQETWSLLLLSSACTVLIAVPTHFSYLGIQTDLEEVSFLQVTSASVAAVRDL